MARTLNIRIHAEDAKRALDRLSRQTHHAEVLRLMSAVSDAVAVRNSEIDEALTFIDAHQEEIHRANELRGIELAAILNMEDLPVSAPIDSTVSRNGSFAEIAERHSSHYIARLEALLSPEEISIASRGAAAPLVRPDVAQFKGLNVKLRRELAGLKKVVKTGDFAAITDWLEGHTEAVAESDMTPEDRCHELEFLYDEAEARAEASMARQTKLKTELQETRDTLAEMVSKEAARKALRELRPHTDTTGIGEPPPSPYQLSRDAFDEYAGMDAPKLPESEHSSLQVSIARWEVNKFGGGDLSGSVHGVNEEGGEWADALIMLAGATSASGRMAQAIIKRKSRQRGMENAEAHRIAIADAVADMAIFAIGACTKSRLDFWTIVSETAHEVMSRDRPGKEPTESEQSPC